MAAKWLHPVLFCNDINIKTLIDITLYDEEHILITCRSFIKRFNLIDKAQVNSWITKSWHPFSSGAVRLPNTDKIYAVVNNSNLYHWPIDEKDIQSFKKCVFKSPIHTLVSGLDSLYIIYSYGFIEPLEDGKKSRKEIKPKLIGVNETILQSHIYAKKKEAALLVKNKEGNILLYQMKISSSEESSCCHIKLENFQLTGSLFVPSGELFTTWSNGSLYGMKTWPKSAISTPGNVKGKLNILETSKKIKILNLSSDHIALQGMNINNEGGLVVLFDTKFGLIVSTKPLKMYKDPPLGWTIPNGVVAADGGSLVYIPVSLSPSTVGSMLGCHVNETYFDDICLGWEVLENAEADNESEKEIPSSAVESLLSSKSTELSSIIRKLNLGTASEDIIVKEVVSSLIEAKNITLLSDCINSFGFITEKCLVSMLNLLLELPDEFFTKEKVEQKHRREKLSSMLPLPQKNVITNGIWNSSETRKMRIDLNENLGADKDVKKVVCPFSIRKCAFINEILVQPFSVATLSEEIKVLDFKSSLTLIQYLHYLLASGNAQILNDKTTDVPTMEKACLWLGLLFDSNYHQFVMTSEVDIYKMLLTVFGDIEALLKFWEASHSIDNLVDRIKTSNLIPRSQGKSSYSMNINSF